jgi:hypothetical protein
MSPRLLAWLIVVVAGLTPAMAQSPGGTTAETGSAALRDAAQQVSQPAAGINVGPLKNVKFNGLVQVWYQAGNRGFVDTLRIRRTELYLGGDVTSRAKFMIMIDPSKGLVINYTATAVDGTRVLMDGSVNHATRILQDAYICLNVAPHLDVQAGQFKVPLNFEGLASSSALPLVERSLITTDRARGGAWGDVRDVGVMARGTFSNGLEYRVGFFNGLGSNQNDLDRDDAKAVAARVAYRTPVPGLHVGAFGAADRDVSTDLERRRVGVDAQYLRGRLLLQGELVGGRDGTLTRRGYYATVAFKIRPTAEVVARFDTWDPDTLADTVTADVAERDYIAGFNYYLSGNNLKWQAEYLRKTYAHGISPGRHVFLTNMQVSW